MHKNSFIIFALVLAFATPVFGASIFQIYQGGTGLGTTPSYGQLLVGNSSSGYTLTATSSLGITSTGGFDFTAQSYGVSTSTTVGFLNGLFSTASSTFTTTFNLSSLSAGGLGVGTGGLVYSGATTTAGTGLTYTSNAFNVNTSQNIATLSNLTSNGFVKTSGGAGTLSVDTATYLTTVDISANTNLTAGDGLTLTDDDLDCDTASGTIFGCLTSANWLTFNNKVGTSTSETAGQLAYFTTTSGSPSLISGVATGTISVGSSAITVTAGRSAIGGALAIDCATATSGQNGCLSSTDWSTFNSKQATLTATWPQILTGATLTFGGLSTSSPISAASGLLYATGANTMASISTSSAVSMSITGLAGTATALATPRAINGVNFDGTAPITITAASSTLLANNNTFSGTNSFASLDVDNLTSALTLTGAGGDFAEYTGASCTNQFIRSLSALGVATCATVGAGDVSLANLTATDATLTFSGTYTGATARTIGLNLANVNSWTGGQTFVNATSTGTLTIPVGASVTTPIAGNIAIDTTTGQLRWADTTGTVKVDPGFRTIVIPFATSTAWTASTTKFLGPAMANLTVVSAYCETDTGTVGVSLYDGTNRADYIPTASTTKNLFTYTTNNTFTAGESMRVDIGTPASTPTKGACRLKITYDVD